VYMPNQNQRYRLRPAVAMIELIFAISVIGIALLSVPNLMSISARSGFVTLQQEAIAEASSAISSIMTYQWDEKDTNESFLPPILKVNNGDDDLSEKDTTYHIRLGTPKESYRKFITEGGTQTYYASTTLGLDSGESKGDEDDIDDFNGEEHNLTLVEKSDNDFIDKNIVIKTTVNYNDDSANYNTNNFSFTPFQSKSGTTNIKEIVVTLTTTNSAKELDKTIVLKAFSCNIGAYKLEIKRF